MWQVRAIQAEERLKQLTAGDDVDQDAPTASPEGSGDAERTRAGQEPARPAGWRRLLWWIHPPRDE
jgi:hypothetical protein